MSNTHHPAKEKPEMERLFRLLKNLMIIIVLLLFLSILLPFLYDVVKDARSEEGMIEECIFIQSDTDVLQTEIKNRLPDIGIACIADNPKDVRLGMSVEYNLSRDSSRGFQVVLRGFIFRKGNKGHVSGWRGESRFRYGNKPSISLSDQQALINEALGDASIGIKDALRATIQVQQQKAD